MGKGSEFSFTLNLPEGNGILVTEPEKSQSWSDQRIEVLLVEDNKVNQLVAKKTLEKWGLLVTIAENSLEAIEKIEENQYQLILMNIHMHGMTGYDATRIIRSMVGDYYKHIKIIALTADVSKEIRQNAIDSGMDDVIRKPFNPDELKSMIHKHVSTIPLNTSESLSASHIFPKLRLFAGGDLKFESELRVLLMNSLRELFGAVKSVLTDKSLPTDFDSILHKSSTTLSLVDDLKINDLLRQIKSEIAVLPKHENRRQQLVKEFEVSVSRVINQLN